MKRRARLSNVFEIQFKCVVKKPINYGIEGPINPRTEGKLSVRLHYIDSVKTQRTIEHQRQRRGTN